jgi:DNA-binding transcriptional LysR family regulator
VGLAGEVAYAQSVLFTLGTFVAKRPKRFVLAHVVLLALCAPLVTDVLPRLKGGGFEDNDAESWQTKDLIERELGQGLADIVAIYRSPPASTIDDVEVLGEVLAAVTALAAPLRGCRSQPLGALRYRVTASPAFMQRHFAAGVDAAALASAPCLVFNRQDRLQDRWMTQQLGGAVVAPPRHWLPSTQGFIDAARAGLGWGLNPEPLVQAELEAGTLQELVPGAVLDVPLHWQQWRASEAQLAPLTQAVRRAAAAVLQPAPAAGTSTMKENA